MAADRRVTVAELDEEAKKCLPLGWSLSNEGAQFSARFFKRSITSAGTVAEATVSGGWSQQQNPVSTCCFFSKLVRPVRKKAYGNHILYRCYSV